MTARRFCVLWLYGKPARFAFHSTVRPGYRNLPVPCQRPLQARPRAHLCCFGVRILCSSLYISVFQCVQASCTFGLVFSIKNGSQSRRGILSFWLERSHANPLAADACGGCVIPLDGVDGAARLRFVAAFLHSRPLAALQLSAAHSRLLPCLSHSARWAERGCRSRVPREYRRP